MLQPALKTALIVVVLGVVVQSANAFGCRGWGCGGWGCGNGGCGYGYSGYGYAGYGGYGYAGYGGYLASSSGGYSSQAFASSSRPSSNSATLTVSVPTNAKVVINGQPTRSTGEFRRYTSNGLQPATVYAYRVRAEFVHNGKPISQEKTVQLSAGQTSSLEFGAAANAQVADVATPAVR
jgi:uncharacterized protein (TIGR03000 family)